MKDDFVDRFMAAEFMAFLVNDTLAFGPPGSKSQHQRHYESKLGQRYIVEYRAGRWIVFGYVGEVPVKEGNK